MKRGLILVILILYFLNIASSLGITHYYTASDRVIEFKPGLKKSYSYSISGDRPDQEIDIYVQGDLSQYAKLSTTKLIGDGGITVDLELPQEIDIPGTHFLYIGAIEAVPEGAGINVRAAIQTTLAINVPYQIGRASCRESTSENLSRL